MVGETEAGARPALPAAPQASSATNEANARLRMIRMTRCNSALRRSSVFRETARRRLASCVLFPIPDGDDDNNNDGEEEEEEEEEDDVRGQEGLGLELVCCARTIPRDDDDEELGLGAGTASPFFFLSLSFL